jgi:hypothetical protein
LIQRSIILVITRSCRIIWTSWKKKHLRSREKTPQTEKLIAPPRTQSHQCYRPGDVPLYPQDHILITDNPRR